MQEGKRKKTFVSLILSNSGFPEITDFQENYKKNTETLVNFGSIWRKWKHCFYMPLVKAFQQI